MDQISILGLEVDCIVGLRAFERRRRQRVSLDLRLDLDLTRAGQTGRISHTLDYSRVADEVCMLLRFREYRLIEMATNELASMLLGVHPILHGIQVRLEKPEALRGRAHSASVEIRREQHERKAIRQSFGLRTTLLENREAGLYLFEVAPGSALPPLTQKDVRCLEWVVSSSSQSERSEGLFVFPEGRRSEYANVSNQAVVLFCCACPGLPSPQATSSEYGSQFN